MKLFGILLATLVATSSAYAGKFVCRSRTQNFVFKQSRDSSFYLVYECDKSITSCTPSMVFEKLGFEEEGSFSLHGQRSNGQRSVFNFVKSKSGWTASLSLARSNSLKVELICD